MRTQNHEEYDDLAEYQESLHDLTALTEDVEHLRDNAIPFIYDENTFDLLLEQDDDEANIIDRFIEEHKNEFREDVD